MLRTLGNLLVVGWFVLAIRLYFKALFHPKYYVITWAITIGAICIVLFAPPQECHVCLDGGYIDGN